MLTEIRRFFWKTDEEIALEESRPPKKDKWDYEIEQRQKDHEWRQIRIRYLQTQVIPQLEEIIESEERFIERYCAMNELKDERFIQYQQFFLNKEKNELKDRKQELFVLKNPLGNRNA
jgi:hypothetical protein